MSRSWIVLCLLSLAACEGYWDTSIQLREELSAELESAQLFPGAPGTLQISVEPPADINEPLWVVGHPEALSLDPAIVTLGWAYGPCEHHPLVEAKESAVDKANPEGQRVRLCVAVFTPSRPLWTEFHMGFVVDARAQGRRFTAVSKVEMP